MADTTTWAWYMDLGPYVAHITVARSDLDGGKPHPIKLKGVCYSPAPLNGSNAFAPAIGDWFWDSFPPIGGWNALWRRDLRHIRRQLGANTIRVYSMLSRQRNANGTIPNPWNSGHLFTHQNFLDECWNLGAPPVDRKSPIRARRLADAGQDVLEDQIQGDPAGRNYFWTRVLQETAATVGQHPAVMGFTIQNELDGADVCYNNPELASFWWGQVETLAALVKKAAPGKLVGMAVHDDPNIPGKAASYMAQCPNIDFWGVNTYQTQSFAPVFGPIPNVGPGYNGLPGAARKPVILTEYGLPATGHRSPNDPSTIYEDASTRAATAAVIGKMAPQAFRHEVGVGMYYFEYCDEWWNQPGSPNIYTWWGRNVGPRFPERILGPGRVWPLFDRAQWWPAEQCADLDWERPQSADRCTDRAFRDH